MKLDYVHKTKQTPKQRQRSFLCGQYDVQIFSSQVIDMRPRQANGMKTVIVNLHLSEKIQELSGDL